MDHEHWSPDILLEYWLNGGNGCVFIKKERLENFLYGNRRFRYNGKKRIRQEERVMTMRATCIKQPSVLDCEYGQFIVQRTFLILSVNKSEYSVYY